jgi:glycosyltransferase involved in cell wall biosynthesis
MRLIYTDPGLRNDLGHHANSCRHIVVEARSRGVPSAVLAELQVSQELRSELMAFPWFRCNTYSIFDLDPVCGWLGNFDFVSKMTQEDFSRVGGLEPHDLIYLNSAQPAQFMGLVRWIKTLPPERRPTVIIEFGTDPGLDLITQNGTPVFVARDPRVDARATLHRWTSRLLSEDDQPWLKLATFDREASSVFQTLLNFPVATLPLPQRAITGCRDRTGCQPVTIGILGHQRLEKGYHIVPELAARLLRERDDIRLLIHNGWPEGLAGQQETLRQMAAADSRLIVDERTANLAMWSELLDQTDLMVCPYNRDRFMSSYSAVASEAIANAIPLVAPQGTTLEVVLREFGTPGTLFADNTVDEVYRAIVDAVDNFDVLAFKAQEAARRWDQTRGTTRLVDTMLDWWQAARQQRGLPAAGAP